MDHDFEIGERYNRREDIHNRYGGQQQSGIITPRKHPFIFLITSSNGEKHGYYDHWEDGIFHYYGEGQKGDMSLTRGNKAILNHIKNKKSLLLFERKEKDLIFQGKLTFIDFLTEFQKDDMNKEGRNVIVFLLKFIDT